MVTLWQRWIGREATISIERTTCTLKDAAGIPMAVPMTMLLLVRGWRSNTRVAYFGLLHFEGRIVGTALLAGGRVRVRRRRREATC